MVTMEEFRGGNPRKISIVQFTIYYPNSDGVPASHLLFPGLFKTLTTTAYVSPGCNPARLEFS